MADADAHDAASSAAPALPPLPSLDSLSSADYDTWRLTGDVPAPPAPAPPTPDADSSPAEPAAQVASTDAPTPPASEPGTSSPKSNAETRKTELSREIEELLARRRQLRDELDADERRRTSPPASDATTAASSPAPDRTLAQTVAHPDPRTPLFTDTDFFAKFPDATLTDYTRYVARHEFASEQARAQVLSEQSARLNGFYTQKAEAEKANPQFWASITPAVKGLVPVDLLPPGQMPAPLNVVAQEIVTSNVAMKLITHLSTHEGELHRLASLPTPQAIAREIGKLEAKLDQTAPPIKAVSSAPPPPSTLGSKPATSVDDEADQALREGNFERYRAVKNREELAALSR